MNLVVISGRLTKDVELSYTQSGVAKATITVAVNREFTKENGEREADFIQCELWRKQAEFAANNLAKGNRVNVQGSWRTGSYENQQGQRVYTNTLNVTSINPIDWANSEQPQQQQTPGQQYQQRSQQNSQYQGQQTNMQQNSQYQGQQTNMQQNNFGQQTYPQQNQQLQPYNQNDPFAQQNNNQPFQVNEDDLPF